MKPNFVICKTDNCSITITGLEKDDLQYVNYIDYREYRYEDCVTINIIIPVDSKQDEGEYIYSINLHDSEIDATTMEFPKDGLYRIVHLIIPTRQWLDEYTIELPNYTYIYEGGKILKIIQSGLDVENRTEEEVTLQEVINVNGITNIYYDDKYTFSICRLKECYYNFCRDYFAKLCVNKCDKLDNYNRDIIWIGLNTIKYLLDLDKYYEAQGILEQLTGCTGLCKPNLKIRNNGNGCRCTN